MGQRGERRAPARPGSGRDRGRSPGRKPRRSRSRSPIKSKLMAMAMHSGGVGGKRGMDSRTTRRSSSKERHAASRLRMDELNDTKHKARTSSPDSRRHDGKGRSKNSLDTAVKRAREERSNYWDKKILEAEEKDPHRWGHSGFKELYHGKRGRNSPGKRTSVSPSPQKRKRSLSTSPRRGGKRSQVRSRSKSLSSDSTPRSPAKASGKSRNRRSMSRSASPSPKRKSKPSTDRKAPDRHVVPKSSSSDKPKPSPHKVTSPSKTPKNGTRKPPRKSRSVSSDSSSSRSRSRIAPKNVMGQTKEKKPHTATRLRSNSSSSSSDDDVLQIHAKRRGRHSSFSHSESGSSSSSDRNKAAKNSDISSSSSESDSSSDASDSDVSVRAKPTKKGKGGSQTSTSRALSPTERVLEEAVKAAAKKAAEAKKKSAKKPKVDKPQSKKSDGKTNLKPDNKDCNSSTSKKEPKPPSESGETESESDSSDSDMEPRMSLSERFAKLSQVSTDKREMAKPVLSANEIDTKMRVVKDFRNPAAPKIYVEGNAGTSSDKTNSTSTNHKALPSAYPADDHQTRRDFSDRHRHMESMYQDNPAERPMEWANPRVRFNYYKDRGCFDERPISFDEYLKWEDWYHKYKEWLEQEGYYQDQEERRRSVDGWNRMQGGGPRPLFSIGRQGFPERSGPPGIVQPLSNRAHFGQPEGNAYLQAVHQRVGGRITRTPGGSLTVNSRQFQKNGTSFNVKRRLGRP